jgi:hypothetical protein
MNNVVTKIEVQKFWKKLKLYDILHPIDGYGPELCMYCRNYTPTSNLTTRGCPFTDIPWASFNVNEINVIDDENTLRFMTSTKHQATVILRDKPYKVDRDGCYRCVTWVNGLDSWE